jgi:hypothetical protein
MKTSQIATLAFYAANAGWYTYHKNTKPQVKRLAELGFLEVNEFNQARFTGKVFA